MVQGCDLKQIVDKGQERIIEGRKYLNRLLVELEGLGADPKLIEKVISDFLTSLIDSDRNLSGSLTRYDNEYLEKRWKEFLTAQKSFNSKINKVIAAQRADLEGYLSPDLSLLGIRYLDATLRKVKKNHNAAIFFSIFKDLLDATHLGDAFANDKEFFKHTLRHVNPNDYLKERPIQFNSSKWRQPIVDLYEIVRPISNSNNRAYHMVAKLIFFAFPTSFVGNFDDGDTLRKYSEKVRRIVEKQCSES